MHCLFLIQNRIEETQAVVTYVTVSGLPKGALVEWHVVANDQARHFTGHMIVSGFKLSPVTDTIALSRHLEIFLAV